MLDIRPYTEQRHDGYKSEPVRDRLALFSLASAVKRCIKHLFSTAYVFWSLVKTTVLMKSSTNVVLKLNVSQKHLFKLYN